LVVATQGDCPTYLDQRRAELEDVEPLAAERLVHVARTDDALDLVDGRVTSEW